MKKAWLSAILNFFFMGLGYLYNGKRPLLGLLLTLAAFGLTYIEQFHTFADGNSLQGHDSTAFLVMFVCVFILNTGLAIDGYNEAKQINTSSDSSTG